MKTKTPLYHKFVNEENYRNIGDIEYQNKYSTYYFLIPILLMVCVMMVTFFGYNLNYLPSIISLTIAFLAFLEAINCTIGFIYRDRMYRVFKKHWHLIAFLMGYFILAAVFLIIPIFTIEYITDESGIITGLINHNVAFLFIAYLPLTIIYLYICYFCFSKCFTIHAREQLKIRKAYREVMQLNENIDVSNDELIAEYKTLTSDESSKTTIKHDFYHKFVNEENIKKIGDIKIQQKFYGCGSLVPWCLFFTFWFLTFSGYSFESYQTIVMLCFAALSLLIAIYLAIRLILLDRKYNVFKKRWYPYVFLLGYFILSIICYLVVIFKITIPLYYDALEDVITNVMFCSFFFVPLLIEYSFICKRVYNKCFWKYTQVGMGMENRKNPKEQKNNIDSENINKEEKKESDDNPTDSNE